jgi:hypothetical protein
MYVPRMYVLRIRTYVRMYVPHAMCTHMGTHSMGRWSICIVEIGLITNNQQLKASDCYKLSLLKESMSK